MLQRMTIDGLIYELSTDHHNTIGVALPQDLTRKSWKFANKTAAKPNVVGVALFHCYKFLKIPAKDHTFQCPRHSRQTH